MISFIVGTICGGLIGFMTAALCVAEKLGDTEIELASTAQSAKVEANKLHFDKR